METSPNMDGLKLRLLSTSFYSAFKTQVLISIPYKATVDQGSHLLMIDLLLAKCVE
jgi:hypothetical protein